MDRHHSREIKNELKSIRKELEEMNRIKREDIANRIKIQEDSKGFLDSIIENNNQGENE